MSFLPLAQLGPYVFSSGASNPKAMDGQKRTNYVIEHEVPGAEGGQIEYVGSQQPTYRLQGFFAPLNDSLTSGGVAGFVISGQSGVTLSPEGSISYFVGQKGSGAQLLQLESTWSRQSGNMVLYENDFFYLTDETFAIEKERAYPYYPYTLDLMRATWKSYGQSSGISSVFPSVSGFYFSGYAYTWQQQAGFAQGETIIGLGVYVPTVASGNARVALFSGNYQSNVNTVIASAAQRVHSGWNYFPVNPSYTTTSGQYYVLGFMGDATNTSGFTVGILDTAGTSGTSTPAPNQDFTLGFPTGLSPAAPLIDSSGIQIALIFITET
jgi:hypothetical protein